VSAFLVLGCGYTGRRVAQRLAARGACVFATTRDPLELSLPGVRVLRVDSGEPWSLRALGAVLPRGVRVLDSIPLVRDAGGRWNDPTPQLLNALGDSPSRVVYISTTGVYGATRDVDEHTPAAPRTPRESLRVAAENAVLAGPWSAMVLRAAAIYGPGRGVHESMRRGEFKLLGAGENWVSRIHVDDLASLAEAALLGDARGAWPVADEEPAQSFVIAKFCSDLLGVPMARSAAPGELSETRRADRRVDGRAVCRLLGVQLRYLSYRTGIPASLSEAAGKRATLESHP
jgi:nucleoside-diphosphate-sugar epimerase